MADMRIFGQVAQSASPYGRITPLGQPGAIAPSQYQSGLSGGALEALGSMFDEWTTDDDTEFLEAEQSLQKELKDVETAYKAAEYPTSWEKPYLRDYEKKVEGQLEELRANPPKSSSFDRGLDSIGDLFGISEANVKQVQEQKLANMTKSQNLFKRWGIA
jgi:hypothetical protein